MTVRSTRPGLLSLCSFTVTRTARLRAHYKKKAPVLQANADEGTDSNYCPDEEEKVMSNTNSIAHPATSEEVPPTAGLDWRKLIADHRTSIAATAFEVTVDADTPSPRTWLELPRPNPACDINAVENLDSGRWEVEAHMQEGHSSQEALAAAEALTTAARQAETMNAPEQFSISMLYVSKDIVGKIGSVVPLVATEFEGVVALHLDAGHRWADNCTTPGVRWSWEDEDSLSPMLFEYIGDYRVVGLDVHDAFSPRVILASTEAAL